jgi:hypothetical protein
MDLCGSLWIFVDLCGSFGKLHWQGDQDLSESFFMTFATRC